MTHDQNISSQVDRVVAMSDGKTSTETVRRRRYEQRGEGDEGIEERAIVDGSGRLQIPKEYLDKLGISGRVRVSMEGDRVVLEAEEE